MTLLLASSVNLSKNFISLRFDFEVRLSLLTRGCKRWLLGSLADDTVHMKDLVFLSDLPFNEYLLLGGHWQLKLAKAAALCPGAEMLVYGLIK